MKICIYGVGAVGGFIGAKLAHAGFEVNAVARGAALEALREHGLRLHSDGIMFSEKVRATDDPNELGVQDLVVVAVKATALASVAQMIAPLMGPDTIVMTAMNGVPWWFFDGFGGEYAGTRLASVDPDGAIAAAIPARNTVGCVVHGSFSLNEPGFVRHGFGKRLIIGEPDGSDSERIRKLAELFGKADLDVVVSSSIQYDLWFKLWGNMTMNPVSAITGGGIGDAVGDVVGGVAEGLGDEGGIVAVVVFAALAAIMAVVVGAGVYLVYEAPFILSEAAFEFILAAGLVRGTKRIDSADWMGSVFKTTSIPFIVTLALAAFAGYLMHHYFPEITRLSELLSRL